MVDFVDIGVGAFPDMGEMGPSYRRFMHLECGSPIRIQENPVTCMSDLICLECGRLDAASAAAMTKLDLVAIVQQPCLVYSKQKGQEPGILLMAVPMG
jgi:hypothetical protein